MAEAGEAQIDDMKRQLEAMQKQLETLTRNKP